MDVAVSRLSEEELTVEITVRKAGVLVDPTADVVSAAVVHAGADPADADWHPAQWETVGASHRIRFGVGPGTAIGQLEVGPHRAWVKIVDTDETPVKRTPNQIVVY